jgi:hypothetical protein
VDNVEGHLCRVESIGWQLKCENGRFASRFNEAVCLVLGGCGREVVLLDYAWSGVNCFGFGVTLGSVLPETPIDTVI